MRNPFVLSLVLGLAACAGTPPPEAARTAVAIPDREGVQRVTVVARSYYFNPSHVTVRAGQPVELQLSREPGLVPHDFTLVAPEAGIDIRVDLSTAPQTVRFTPTRPGRYPFFCSQRFLGQSHRERGMTGVLEVKA